MKAPAQPLLLGLDPSFGFGDPLGGATPGHVEAMQRSGCGISPVFAQYSSRDRRGAQQVMDSALEGVRAAGWAGVFGADADHLDSEQEIDAAFASGFTWFTIDLNQGVDEQAYTYDEARLRRRFAELREAVDWDDYHASRKVPLDTGTAFVIDEETMMRVAVKYVRALQRAMDLSRYIDRLHRESGKRYEVELCMATGGPPTTLAEHYLVADHCLAHGMKLVSLAPGFAGQVEDGGDLSMWEASFRDHNAIADQLGPYKLSWHAGPDELSRYSAFARATDGRFHVKPAGTTWGEVLRLVARCEPGLFDRIRHCTTPARVSAMLRDADLEGALRTCLSAHSALYSELLAERFARHLDALMEGM